MFGLFVLCVLGFGVAIYCLFLLVSSIREAREKKRLEEARQRAEQERWLEEKNRRIKNTRETLASLKGKLKQQEASIEEQIQRSFEFKSQYTHSAGHWDKVYAAINNTISDIQGTIAAMKMANATLIKEAYEESQSEAITQEANRIIPKARQLAEDYKAFGQRVQSLPTSLMMDRENYGKVNVNFWNAVSKTTRNDADAYIRNCEKLLTSKNFDGIFQINPEKVVQCMWVFATEKPFSVADFERANRVVDKVFKYIHIDCTIADLYAQKNLGGEEALRDPVRKLLSGLFGTSGNWLSLIASGFMWMNAYQSEQAILQHMATNKMEMSAKAQERLRSLASGGGNAPSGFNVKSSTDSLYFDVSALAWRDNDYIGFFDNLTFQDKQLTYSLAIRDENKDLFNPQGITLPDSAVVLEKIKAVFAEEYGPVAKAKLVNCVALSGGGKEELDGILATSNDCKQLGVLIHVARIGRRLVIKFYTLVMPTGANLDAQRQQALSMYQKLSPTVTMWESSLKDTMLMAVEQLLNTTLQGTNGSSGEIPVEPIF